MTITPGPAPNAASMAMTMSPTTATSPETNSDTSRRTTSAITGKAPPAIPTQVFSIPDGPTLAAAQACRMAAPKLSRARASPTRTTLLPADVPVPNTEFRSPITHEVLLPPPSTPRKMLTSVVLPQKPFHHGDHRDTEEDTPRHFAFAIASQSSKIKCSSLCLCVSVVKSLAPNLRAGYLAQISHCANPKLDTLEESEIHEPGQTRSCHHWAVSRRDHPVRFAFPQTSAHAARLLPRRPQHSLVGDCALDCGRRNQHAHHHQYSRVGLRYESHISPGCLRISGGTRHHQFCFAATILSRRSLYRL